MSVVSPWRQALDPVFFRDILRLALPISLQCVLMSSMGLIDILMVGQLGEVAVAAVGLGSKFFFVIILLLSGLASGAGILASQYWGAKHPEGVRRVLALSLCLGTGLMCLLALILALFPEPLVGLATQNPAVLADGAAYLRIGCLYGLLTAWVMLFESHLRCIGQANAPMLLSFLALGLNVLFNYALILPHGDWPGMGVAGAALATVLARLVQALLLLALIYWPRHLLAVGLADLRAALRHQEWQRFWPVTMPVLLNEFLWALGIWVYFLIYGRMGTQSLAVMSLLSPIESMAISVFLGVGFGSGILLGHHLGARAMERAYCQAWFLVLVTPLLSILLGLALWLASEPILGLFDAMPAETLELARLMYLLTLLALPLRVYNMVAMLGVLRSGGDTRFCLWTDLGCQWLCGIPFSAIAGLVLGWSLPWVFLLASLEEVLKILLGSWRIRTRRWLRNLVDAEPQQQAQVPG